MTSLIYERSAFTFIVLRFAAHSESMRNRVEFLMEAVLMADFDHRNVMWLIAIVIDDGMVPHVLLPLMRHGDLRSFVAEPTNVSIFVKKYLAITFIVSRHQSGKALSITAIRRRTSIRLSVYPMLLTQNGAF